MDQQLTPKTTETTPTPSAYIPPPPVPMAGPGVPDVNAPYSYARPVWYVVLMFIATFGLYGIVWFHRCWKVLLSHFNLRGNAVVNAIFNPLCAFSFFRYAYELGGIRGFAPTMPANLAATLYLVLAIGSRVFERIATRVDDSGISSFVGLVFFLLSAIPLSAGVHAMNAGAEEVQPGHRMRTSLSPWAIVALVLGGILWSVVLLGIVGTLLGWV